MAVSDLREEGVMRRETEATSDISPVDLKCAHNWIIESPEGPTSKGVCKFCGAESEFNNFVPYPSWLDAKLKLPKKYTSKTELGEAMNGFLQA